MQPTVAVRVKSLTFSLQDNRYDQMVGVMSHQTNKHSTVPSSCISGIPVKPKLSTTEVCAN